MNQIDFLEAQLNQARAALDVARQLQRAAEEQRNAAVEQLRSIAAALLAHEWNLLRREHPEAASWSPERLGAWIIDTGTRKLNRLELLGSGGVDILESCAQERDYWQARAEKLQQEIERLTRERDEILARLQVRDEENQRLRVEIARLNQRVAELSAQATQQTGMLAEMPRIIPVSPIDDQLAKWQASPDYSRDVEAVRIIGQYGYVLRESVARALGIDSQSGTAIRLFERLREAGIIEERPSRMEGRGGKTPYLISLTEKGRQVYRSVFGNEPVEPEDRRLIQRHKSEEQAMLALQARIILEEHGAEFIDLFPDPQPLPGGGVFEIDLVTILNGQKLFVELERAPRGLRRVDKWDRYAQLTRAFYFFVPNKDALGRLMTELNYWAYHSSLATGVVVHVCQVSGGRNKELWHFVRPLVGKSS